MKIQILIQDDCIPPHKAYSYGDSAGFAPDFPFNGARANLVRGKSKINCSIFTGQCRIQMQVS
jgi:hypothetical protein